ncbi:MAG: ATP-binding cassette domain-containing protein [bacterium]|nr:ATP-binding cassette domain-containing protein [bacterium]
MPQIMVEKLIKTFQVAERSTGFMGAVKGLVHRKYRTVNALDGIDFSLDQGELVGLIGPNGAGKSTTVKILSGIMVPDSGRVEVMGRIPWKERIESVRHIGVVFGQRTQLWWDLPVIESYQLLKDIYRIPDRQYKNHLDRSVELLDLKSLLDVPVRQLSLGQRMKCDLAAVLLHSPKILYLDEPTIGLDAVSKLAIRDIIGRINREQGVTVILTTHDMDDIETLCRRVIVINQGKIFMDGTLQQLRSLVTTERRLIVDMEDAGAVVSDPDAELIKREGHRVWLRFDPERVAITELINRIAGAHQIRDLFVENPPIEEIIAKLYGRAAL